MKAAEDRNDLNKKIIAFKENAAEVFNVNYEKMQKEFSVTKS